MLPQLLTRRISPSVSTSRPPIFGVHCVGEVKALGGHLQIAKVILTLLILLYISICLLLHDLPWMLLLRCCCLDHLDCSTALDCLLLWDSGQPSPSPGLTPLDPSPLWIPPTGLQPLQGSHLHLPISYRSAGAALWLHLGSLAHLAPPKRGLQGLLLYPVLGWFSPPTRLARPVAVYWPLTPSRSLLPCFPRTPETNRSIKKTFTVI